MAENRSEGRPWGSVVEIALVAIGLLAVLAWLGALLYVIFVV